MAAISRRAANFHVRAQRRQPGNAAAHRVVTLTFQVVEEGQDQRWRDVGEPHRRGRLVQTHLGELQEQRERIAVGRHGACAQRALLGQVSGEERLHQRREAGWGGGVKHRRTPRHARRRRNARTWHRPGHQLGHAGEMPVRVGDPEVTDAGGQREHPLIGVHSLLAPQDQPPDGEAVTKVVHPRLAMTATVSAPVCFDASKKRAKFGRA